ncbi:MAG: BamA/TamA family outer membrane protein [Bacteroidia bacterium]
MSIAILLISGCNVLRFVPKGKSLVDRNRVKIEGNEKIEDLNEQILLVPNRKMLGVVKFNLWSYYFGQKAFKRDSVVGRIKTKEGKKKIITRGKKVNKLKRIFTEIIGEKPVYYDSIMVRRSEINLKNFLYQKGYYNASVSSTVKTYLKRSYITYNITPRTPYEIRKIEYNGSDIILDKAANEFGKSTNLKIGDRVDGEKLGLERDRLTSEYRNHGFYYFNKSFIEILVDTGGHNRGANVYYIISNPGGVKNASQQTIQKVVVEMNFRQQFGRRDTLTFPKENGIKYLFNGYNIKPNIINRSVLLRPDSLFSQKNLEATYNKLIGLGLFTSVNISVLPYKSDTTNKILVYINLTPSSKHDLYLEPQIITSDKQTDLNSQDNNPRNYGLAAAITLNNKNVLRNAEDFNIKFRTAAEKQFGSGSGRSVVLEFFKDTIAKFKAANFESNLTFELLFPKLVGLRKLDLKPYLKQSRTSINLTLLTEINSTYERKSLPINFTWQTRYQTKDKQSFNFYYSPIQLSFNKAKIDTGFLNRLNTYDSLRLVRSFRSYIIASQKASVEYNNMSKSPNLYWNIRSTLFELSGNLLELGFRIAGEKQQEKTIRNVQYFQYFRTDIDATRYRIFGKNKTLVLRANLGFALPYGNSVIMPLERQFFVGGSNSLRGWRPRVLGPGNYNDNSEIQLDRTGDVMIVTNAEYRFAIAPGKADGAFFLDAGNIWSFGRKASIESKLTAKFYNQLAINTGVGFRFNLDFFILRLDFGVPLHDPSKPEGERLVVREFKTFRWGIDNIRPSLAVGYPF